MDKKQYQVICKSAATFLKTTFDKLGIESEYVLFTGDDDSIRHWFIAVKGNDDRQYFLTLAADLSNIKNHLPTEHFATSIFNLDEQGNVVYEIPKDTNFRLRKSEKNGVEFEEIDHDILDYNYLKELDNSIGYSNLYDLDTILRKNPNLILKEYMVTLQEKSEIFNIYRECLEIKDDGEPVHYLDVDEKQVDLFLKKLSLYVLKEIDKTYYIDAYRDEENLDEALKDYLILSLESIGIDTSSFFNKSLSEILDEVSKDLRKAKKNKNISKTRRLELNTIEIIQQLKTLNDLFYTYTKEYKEEVTERFSELCNLLGKCDDYDERQKLIGEFKEDLEKDRKNGGLKRVNPILMNLTSLLDSSYKIKGNSNHRTLDYVYDKFITMFPRVFDCNFEDYKTSSQTDFSTLGYNEQIETIKKLLNEMFRELDISNSSDIINYDKRYTAVENRIQPFPIFDPETRDYYIGFVFGRRREEPERLLVYYPKKNTLEKASLIDISQKYWLASTRFNAEIDDPRIYQQENLEKIEEETITRTRTH